MKMIESLFEAIWGLMAFFSFFGFAFLIIIGGIHGLNWLLTKHSLGEGNFYFVIFIWGPGIFVLSIFGAVFMTGLIFFGRAW